MALTKEEREKIIEEETLRNEIRNKNKENPIDKYAANAFGGMLFYILAVVGYFAYAVYFK